MPELRSFLFNVPLGDGNCSPGDGGGGKDILLIDGLGGGRAARTGLLRSLEGVGGKLCLEIGIFEVQPPVSSRRESS